VIREIHQIWSDKTPEGSRKRSAMATYLGVILYVLFQLLLLPGMASGATLVDLTFPTDVSALNSATVSHSASETADFGTGVCVINGASGSDRPWISFDERTTGYTRVTVEFKCVDTYTDTTNAEFTWFYGFASDKDVDTAGSSDSAFTFYVNRRSSSPQLSTTTYFRFGHRNLATGLLYDMLIRRDTWTKAEVIVDHAADTYDIYIDGYLFVKDSTCPAGGDFNRFAMSGTSSNGNVQVGRIKVESGADLGEPSTNVLLHQTFTTSPLTEIETQYPDIDHRHAIGYSQPAKVPDDTTTYGSFTITASGAYADASKACAALWRGTSDGRTQAVVKLSPDGVRGFQLFFRNWGGLGDGSFLSVDYDSSRSAGTQLRLYQGTTMLQQTAGDGGVTFAAGETKTVRVEYRGVYIQVYIDNVLQTSLTHTVTTTSNGARGLLNEENVGIGLDTTRHARNNYFLSFTHYGDLADTERRVKIDGHRYGIQPFGVTEHFDDDCDFPTRNQLWSHGYQICHMEEGDRTERGSWLRELYSGHKLYSLATRGNCWREDSNVIAANARSYMTLTPRGMWVREEFLYTKRYNSNYAPDNDYRPELTSNVIDWSYRMAAGGVTPGQTTKGFATWATIYSGRNAGACQLLTTGTNKTLNTIASFQLTGFTANTHHTTIKRLGNGDPLSVAMGVGYTSLTAGTEYALSRLAFFETGASVAKSDTFRANLLDDLEQPAVLSVSVGSINTGAWGSLHVGGFNYYTGWYELTASSNAVSFAFDGVTDRVRPQFHVANLPNVASVTVDGVAQTLGTDYWVTDDGDGGVVVGFTGTLADDASIAISGTGGPSLAEWNRLLRSRNLGSASDTETAYERLRRALMSTN
jgi:hypothetical protein